MIMTLLAATIFWLSLSVTFGFCIAMVAIANGCCDKETRRRLMGRNIIQLRDYPPVDYIELEQELVFNSDGTFNI